jgi:nucleoid-associated protein YgaU
MAQDFSTYVVTAGDSLSAIALKVYGDASRWTEIWEANKDKVQDPNLISVGQELRIPGHVGAEAKAVKGRRDYEAV